MIMTEHEIELRVEHMMDQLDKQVLAGNITKKNYDQAIKELDDWAQAKLDALIAFKFREGK